MAEKRGLTALNAFKRLTYEENGVGTRSRKERHRRKQSHIYLTDHPSSQLPPSSNTNVLLRNVDGTGHPSVGLATNHERLPSAFSLGPYADSTMNPDAENFIYDGLAGIPVYADNHASSPRLLPSLPLPPQWSRHHDRAICFMDARSGCSLRFIVKSIKRSYPELAMARLTPGMVEKRLRVLDQNVYINYWDVALRMGVNEVDEGEEQESCVDHEDATR